MPALVVPNAAVLRLIWSLSGQPYAVNVLGVNKNAVSTITQTTVNTLGAAIKTSFSSSGLAGVVGTAVSLQSVGLRDINSANQPELFDVGAAVPGTAVGDLLPPQIALVVTLRSALAGRSFRGRCFLTGYAESANGATGQASAGAGTASSGFTVAIAGNLGASGFSLAIISRPAPGASPPRPTGMVNNVIAHVVRDLVWDTQRRRAVAGI